MKYELQRHWRRLGAGCAAVLAAGFLAPLAVKAPELHENRKLAPAPPPPRSLADVRRWTKAADAYVSDRFPARARLIAGLNYLRYRAGVSGSERILVGRDGWLFYDNGTHLGAARNDPPFNDADARAWLAHLAGRTEWLRQRGVPYLVLVSPDKEFVEPQHGPTWYRGPDPNRAAALLGRLNAVAQAGEIVDPEAELRRQAGWGLAVYNPVETHWTGLGAYYGYAALMRRLQALGLGEGPRPLESFREVAEPRKPRNLALMLGIASFVDADYPEFADPAVRPSVSYFTAATDWTAPQVVDTGLAGKPVLMMQRDSFSLALLPFLEAHFSRIVLTHDQDGFWRPELVERFKPGAVVLQVIESGAPFAMNEAPPASPAALARIDRALAGPYRLVERAPTSAAPPPAPKVVEGGPGADQLQGGPGPEVINGRAGDDGIHAAAGDDTVRGGRGNDLVDGGDGDDWLSGDRGDDTLVGGRGADTFYGGAGLGQDLVLDFSAADGDRVELATGSAYVVRQAGRDTVIEMQGARLVLRGVAAARLPPGWLIQRPPPRGALD